MNMYTNVGDSQNRCRLIGCMLLALLATTISLSVSMFTGWQLGESLSEKLVMAAFGVLAVLGAHLLLVLCRATPTAVRLAAIVLWLFCMTYVVYSHANFFLLSQQRAGERRAASIDQSSSMAAPMRNLAQILSDQAKIKTELAAKSRINCSDGCFSQRVKLISLNSRLDALIAEAGDVKRWQTAQDRQDTLMDAVRDDPVTLRLAKLWGVTVTQTGLVTSLLFSVILEGVACLCWCAGFQFRDLPVTRAVIPVVAAVLESMEASGAEVTQSVSELDSKVEELIREVRAGRLKLTVTGVRAYCRCAQTRAAELKRLVEAELNKMTRIC